jgi:hypothetical protein
MTTKNSNLIEAANRFPQSRTSLMRKGWNIPEEARPSGKPAMEWPAPDLALERQPLNAAADWLVHGLMRWIEDECDLFGFADGHVVLNELEKLAAQIRDLESDPSTHARC